MTQPYAVGDRVRVIGEDVDPEDLNQVGTIIAVIDVIDELGYEVAFDDTNLGNWFFFADELVPAPDAEPVEQRGVER
jgi:hypothetical protein